MFRGDQERGMTVSTFYKTWWRLCHFSQWCWGCCHNWWDYKWYWSSIQYHLEGNSFILQHEPKHTYAVKAYLGRKTLRWWSRLLRARPSTPWKRCGSFEALSYGISLFWGGSRQELTSIQIRMLRMYIRKTGEIFLKTTKRNDWRGFRFRLWWSLKVDTPIINVQVC